MEHQCNVFDPELDGVFDELPPKKEDCPECIGTGNFYGNDEDGDFLPCDACEGTGFKNGKQEADAATAESA